MNRLAESLGVGAFAAFAVVVVLLLVFGSVTLEVVATAFVAGSVPFAVLDALVERVGDGRGGSS